MRRLETSASFVRFREIGGVLEFVVFDDANGDADEAISAICAALPGADAEALRKIGSWEIDDARFYGRWCENGSLVMVGRYKGDKGELINPRVRDLGDQPLGRVEGGGAFPLAGSGGDFAYAFSNPPYGLWARPQEVQDLFDEIRHFIMPPGVEHRILDWTTAELPKVHRYFQAGMEWWGVFLFTIYVPDRRRLTVILGSATD